MISLRQDGSYIYSLKWIKNKEAAINSKNNYDSRFQYVLTVVLNNKQIKTNLQITSKISPCINKYEWKDINFPLHVKNWKKV